MAASTNCSSHVNCYATLRTYLAQLLIHWEQREQRSKLTEERHSRKLLTRRPYTTTWSVRRLQGETDMTRACQHSLPARARARSITHWLFRLFSNHISGMQTFQENRHITIHVLVVEKPLVALIGRFIACKRRQTNIRTDQVP